jgi:hypothetical protein
LAWAYELLQADGDGYSSSNPSNCQALFGVTPYQSHPTDGPTPQNNLWHLMNLQDGYWTKFTATPFPFPDPAAVAGVAPVQASDRIYAHVTISLPAYDGLTAPGHGYLLGEFLPSQPGYLMQAMTLIHELGHVYNNVVDQGSRFLFGESHFSDDSSFGNGGSRRTSFIKSALNTDMTYNNCIVPYFKSRGHSEAKNVSYRPDYWGQVFDSRP